VTKFLLSGRVHKVKQAAGSFARSVSRANTAFSHIVKDALVLTHRAIRPRRPGSRTQTHVLLIDTLLPDPLFGAGHPRAFELVRALIRTGHRVSVYPLVSTKADLKRMRTLFENSVTFHQGGGARGLRRLLWRFGETFDVLLISRPEPMKIWADLAWRPIDGAAMPRVIYDAEALIAPRERRRRALFGRPWTDAGYRAALNSELSLMSRADAIAAVGYRDAASIRSAIDVPVTILPHPVDRRASTPDFGGRGDFLFVGRLTGTSSESPNVDSLVWFLRDIMPQIDAAIGTGYRFHIAGLVAAPELIAGDRVVLHGVVDDLTSLFDRCRVFVAPTRYSAGIPLKVVEAMGNGIPCVATSLLRDQLGAHEAALPSGDTPEDFAAQCARLYQDAAAWHVTRQAQHTYLTDHCTPAMFDRALRDLVGLSHNAPDEMAMARH
jgi:glycosyltransferase involved in cell wall biosynthesis